MRHLILSLLVTSACFCHAEINVETVTKSDADRTPVARNLTVSDAGNIVYRCFAALDPALVGAKMPPYKETFYIEDHPLLIIKWFPKNPEMEFASHEDFIVRIKQDSPRQIVAISGKRQIRLEWKEDEKGFLAIFNRYHLNQ